MGRRRARSILVQDFALQCRRARASRQGRPERIPESRCPRLSGYGLPGSSGFSERGRGGRQPRPRTAWLSTPPISNRTNPRAHVGKRAVGALGDLRSGRGRGQETPAVNIFEAAPAGASGPIGREGHDPTAWEPAASVIQAGTAVPTRRRRAGTTGRRRRGHALSNPWFSRLRFTSEDVHRRGLPTPPSARP